MMGRGGLDLLEEGVSPPLGKWIPLEMLGNARPLLADEPLAQLDRVKEEYRVRAKFAKHRLQHRRRLLFYGPPGNGKTYSARSLAGSLRLPLFIVPTANLLGSLLGESPRIIQSLFAFLVTHPCVAVIDECDAIAAARVPGGTNCDAETNRTVNTLLQVMEDAPFQGLVVMTTNFERELDRALHRRFDATVYFGNPGHLHRGALIELTLEGMRPTSLKLPEIVAESKGLSAALVVKACDEAKKQAILNGANVVNTSAVLTEVRRLRTSQEHLAAL